MIQIGESAEITEENGTVSATRSQRVQGYLCMQGNKMWGIHGPRDWGAPAGLHSSSFCSLTELFPPNDHRCSHPALGGGLLVLSRNWWAVRNSSPVLRLAQTSPELTPMGKNLSSGLLPSEMVYSPTSLLSQTKTFPAPSSSLQNAYPSWFHLLDSIYQ